MSEASRVGGNEFSGERGGQLVVFEVSSQVI
jgi:hypothetical protein